MQPIPVLIPLLNPNEPEANLISLRISEGQHVFAGEVLCTLETTKSAADVVAEGDGYVSSLKFSIGQIVRAGEVLCFLADSPPLIQPDRSSTKDTSTTDPNKPKIPVGLRITQPALDLAERVNFDLEQLPIGPLVTESVLSTIMQKNIENSVFPTVNSEFDPQALVIYGGGGHGKMLIDLVRALGLYHIVGIVDDGLNTGEKVMGIPVIGNSDVLPDLRSKGVKLALNAVGGIGDVGVRLKVFKTLAETGFVCPAIIHPSAVVEPSADISPAVQIFANAYIGSQVQIGYGVIVNTGVIISHDCKLEDYAIISPGAILAGEVTVGKGALIGMAANVNLRASIGDKARVGNGSTVKTDVPKAAIVRAGSVWPSSD